MGELTELSFTLKYVHVFDDVNSVNFDKINEFYHKANVKIFEINNPGFMESAEISAKVNATALNSKSIEGLLVSVVGMPAESAYEVSKNIYSELRLLVKSDDAVKSSVIKVVYWLKTYFKSALNNKENNIYIQCSMNKHILFTVYTLSKLGNNIVIVDNTIKRDMYSLYNNMQLNLSGTSEKLKLGGKAEIDVTSALDIIDADKVTNEMTLLIGEDIGGEVINTLCRMGNAKNSELAIYKDGIQMPLPCDIDDVKIYCDKNEIEALRRQLNPALFNKIASKQYRNDAFKFAQDMIAKETNYGKAVNKLRVFVALLNKYDISARKHIYYGKANKHVIRTLQFIGSLGKQVVIVDSKGEMENSVDQEIWRVVQVGNSVEYHEYPSEVVNNSLAYNASREIDELLYNGETPGLYRDRQFKTCKTIKMNTTFDELLILWNNDNTVRPGFESSRNEVTVPVIYASILGVCDDYMNKLSQLLGEHTVVCYGTENIHSLLDKQMQINRGIVEDIPLCEQMPLVRSTGLNIEALHKASNFTYSHLSTEVQNHILDNIDRLLSGGNNYGLRKREFIDRVLSVGLNLCRRIQQEIQWYDYTKQSPKLVVVCNSETQIDVNDAILCNLLNSCGWDIVFIIPTHYNILGKYIDTRDVQQHTIGNAVFDMNITEIKQQKKKSLFGRLFNQGG